MFETRSEIDSTRSEIDSTRSEIDSTRSEIDSTRSEIDSTRSEIDSSVSGVMGVHQPIGMKGVVLFGSDAQKERLLPDLASGRRLAALALTEPQAGSDAYHLQSRAVRQPDGSWKLNGEKRFIGNGESPRRRLRAAPGLRPGRQS